MWQGCGPPTASMAHHQVGALVPSSTQPSHSCSIGGKPHALERAVFITPSCRTYTAGGGEGSQFQHMGLPFHAVRVQGLHVCGGGRWQKRQLDRGCAPHHDVWLWPALHATRHECPKYPCLLLLLPLPAWAVHHRGGGAEGGSVSTPCHPPLHPPELCTSTTLGMDSALPPALHTAFSPSYSSTLTPTISLPATWCKQDAREANQASSCSSSPPWDLHAGQAGRFHPQGWEQGYVEAYVHMTALFLPL